MRILVVEDERDLNRIICKRLGAAGYSTDACFDGLEALDYLAAAEYDAAVFDVMMPKLDGFAAVRRMREGGDNTPVLFLTATASPVWTWAPTTTSSSPSPLTSCWPASGP